MKNPNAWGSNLGISYTDTTSFHTSRLPVGFKYSHKRSVISDGGEYRTAFADISLSPKINASLLSVHPNCLLIISASFEYCWLLMHVIKYIIIWSNALGITTTPLADKNFLNSSLLVTVDKGIINSSASSFGSFNRTNTSSPRSLSFNRLVTRKLCAYTNTSGFSSSSVVLYIPPSLLIK